MSQMTAYGFRLS